METFNICLIVRQGKYHLKFSETEAYIEDRNIGLGCSCNYFGRDSVSKYCETKKSKDFL